MNSIGKVNYKKKKRTAAAGGLLLLVLMCLGCGRAEEVILIGTAGEGASEELWLSQGKNIQTKEWAEVQDGGAEDKTLIRVYVCGAVVNPGVVSVPEGSRVEDALAEAGGFAPEAMRQARNLADWVTDGQMLYFPAEGEAWDGRTEGYELEAGGGPGQNTVGGQIGGTNQEAGRVNINTADAAELMTLPGIGQGRAGDIIAYREKNGNFASCEDIMKVSGIKTSVYEKISDKIRVK